MVVACKQLPGKRKKLIAGGANWQAVAYRFPKVVIKGFTPVIQQRVQKEIDELLAGLEDDFPQDSLSGSPFIRVSSMMEDSFKKFQQDKLEHDEWLS